MKQLTQIFQTLLGVVALILTAIIAFGRLTWRTIRNWWKKRSKWFHHSIVTIIILIPIGLAALVAYACYEDKYGRDYCDMDLSDNISLHSFSDNTWRVYNNTTEEYITDKINWISSVPENDSLAVYALSDKRGYINVNTGRIVIDAAANDYHKAWVFSDGLAAVMKDGKIGFINAKNEVVIPFQFDYTDDCRMYNFGYIFHNGYCAMPNTNGDLGLINKTGNWVVEPAYDEIWAPHTSGYRVIIKDNKHGVLNADCVEVYPAEYGYINILPEGFVLAKEGKQWQEDFERNIVKPFMFDNTYYLNYPTEYNDCGEIKYALSDFVKYGVINSYGIMNRITGEPITPAIFSEINMLSKDLFEVRESDKYEWYLLDAKGNVVPKE